MSQNQYAHALAVMAQYPAMPVFADLGSWVAWNAHHLRESAHTVAAEIACDLGERSMRGPQRAHKPNRRRPVAAFAAAGLVAYVTARKAGQR